MIYIGYPNDMRNWWGYAITTFLVGLVLLGVLVDAIGFWAYFHI